MQPVLLTHGTVPSDDVPHTPVEPVPAVHE
jgi:hypothetical protein